MQYDFSLAAGAGVTLDIAGKFFKYKSGTGLIRVRGSSGGYLDLMPGQGVWGTEFTSLTVQDRSGAQNVGVLLAGNDDFRDDRITGDVTVLDNGKSRSMSGVSFFRMRAAGPAATQYAWVQVFNPIGSGKTIALNKIVISADTAGFAGMFSGQIDANTGVNYATAKTLGMPDGVLKCSANTAAAYPPAAIGAANNFGVLTLAAGANVELPMRDPIVLREGWGFAVAHTIAGASVTMICEIEQF